MREGLGEDLDGDGRVCESCARPDDDLAAVRRIYLDPESPDRAATAQTAPGQELWCFSCRSMYPHELADDA